MTDEINIDTPLKSYGSKIDLFFLLTRQLEKVRQAGSVEFRGGYWDKKQMIVNGNVVTEEIYVPDTRQVFIESVNTLRMFLKPYIDQKFKDVKKKLKEEVDALFKPADNDDAGRVEYFSKLLQIKTKEAEQLIMLCKRQGLFGVEDEKDEEEPMGE